MRGHIGLTGLDSMPTRHMVTCKGSFVEGRITSSREGTCHGGRIPKKSFGYLTGYIRGEDVCFKKSRTVLLYCSPFVFIFLDWLHPACPLNFLLGAFRMVLPLFFFFLESGTGLGGPRVLRGPSRGPPPKKVWDISGALVGPTKKAFKTSVDRFFSLKISQKSSSLGQNSRNLMCRCVSLWGIRLTFFL